MNKHKVIRQVEQTEDYANCPKLVCPIVCCGEKNWRENGMKKQKVVRQVEQTEDYKQDERDENDLVTR